MQTNKIALVLGAGGAKGYAHIGAIRAIEESGATITSIAGTSMGALVGGLYAAGKLWEAYEWLRNIGSWEVFKLTDLKNISQTGLIDGEYIMNELHRIVGDVRIEDLPIPFYAVAANLDTGEEVVFRRGKLLDAIRASISIPAVFAPPTINGKRYVDGGIVNGLPINRVERTPGDRVFAVNLDTYGNPSGKVTAEIKDSIFNANDVTKMVMSAIPLFLPVGIVGKMVASAAGFISTKVWRYILGENLFSVFLHSFYISLKQNKLAMVAMTKPDMYINIDLQGYKTQNFADAEVIAKLGYTQVKKMIQK